MKFCWRWTWLLILGIAGANPVNALTISVDWPQGTSQNKIVRHAAQDAVNLLKIACDCPVNINQPDAEVHLMLPEIIPGADTIPTSFAANRPYPYLHYPRHDYRWTSRPQSGQILLVLETSTAQGIANGIYGLLQEQLGFYFIHPRETIFPCIDEWPLPASFSFSGRPRFDKKGFHIHAMHPLELTEVLHDPDFPQGSQLIRQYIDWLARNQQNWFDFNLLETVDFPRWLPYARDFNGYAHERGILTSIDVSLHMVQQYAFKLVRFPPASLRSSEHQINKRLDQLVNAGFDIINMEFSIAEFVGGLEGMRHRMREEVLEKLEEYPQVKLMGRQHVVKAEDELGKKSGKEYETNDPARGVLIHTVMCYALDDALAPVYELDNFNHIQTSLAEENQVRETWFYPESAYWITFDNSVPMLLLPYLDARFRDLRTVEKMNIPGHGTFSSGWEWGYWLVDWSIARWSWAYEENGRAVPQNTIQPLGDVLQNRMATQIFSNMMALQQQELLQQNLLRWLCPATLPDEVGGSVGKQFQPRPSLSLGEVYENAPPEWEDSLAHASRDLGRFGRQQVQLAGEFLTKGPQNGLEGQIVQELGTALKVTGMYALHQSAWYDALKQVVYEDADPDAALERCVELREFAQQLVVKMESGYRYPIQWLGRKRSSFTSYQYGYLYPVSELHFWKRREEQLRKGKLSSPFFMNIFDPLRIGGLKK